jgi:predicted Zn finger-like uncharacterized protein
MIAHTFFLPQPGDRRRPMIVQCPNCMTRYALPRASLGPVGRKVRCHKCHHVWHEDGSSATASGGDDTADEPYFTTEEEPFAHDGDDGGVNFTDDAMPSVLRTNYDFGDDADGVRKRRGVRLGSPVGWALLILLLAGIGAAGVLYRDLVVRYYPPAALVYHMAGLPLHGMADGLVIPQDRLSITEAEGADGKVLTISGVIVNQTANETLRVPALTALLSNRADAVLAQWLIAPIPEVIGPGEVAIFQSQRPNPPAEAVQVGVRFADIYADQVPPEGEVAVEPVSKPHGFGD